MSESKFFVVCYADTVENYSRPSDDDDVFTISKDSKKTGWNNDGDCPGYGLTKPDALELANSANDCNRYKSLAEKLVEALLFVVNEHKLSNRELLRMGARPNKPCATVLKALEALSLAREMGVLE